MERQQLVSLPAENVSEILYDDTGMKSTEGPNMLTGKMKYGDDFDFENLLYVGFVRSPYAHAKILSIDPSKAMLIPGVKTVVTSSTIAGSIKLGSHMYPYPEIGSKEWLPGVKAIWKLPLADSKVHFVGESVAAVVCNDQYSVEDAIEAVEVNYELLPAVSNIKAAERSDSPIIYEGQKDNIAMTAKFPKGFKDDFRDIYKVAYKIIDGKFEHQRVSPSPMETRNVTATYDESNGILTIIEGTQNPSWIRTQVANALSLSEEKVRVISPRSGGAFGVKSGGAYDETFVVSFISKSLCATVRWVETRTEHFISSGHAREQHHKFKVAVSIEGKILALEDKIKVDGGAINTIWSSWQSTLFSITGPYKIQNLSVELTGFFTNKAPYWAYRGYGKYDAAVALERIMDKIARELKMDPIEIRRRNIIRSFDFPYETPTGALIDSGNYENGIETALDRIDYNNVSKIKEKLRKEGKIVGFGLIVCMEPTGIGGLFGRPGYETVRIRISPTFDVVVETATTDQGQSHGTIISQVVANELSMSPANILTREGDTMNLPYGVGTISSRFSTYTVSAIVYACRKVKEKILKIASFKLGLEISELILKDGFVVSKREPLKRISYRDISQAAYLGVDELPESIEPGLEFTYSYRFPTIGRKGRNTGMKNIFATYPYIVHTALVEVDPVIGSIKVLKYVAVHDCGTPLNKKEIEVHSIGSLAQGIGSALSEEIMYDENGQILTSSFWDYIVPMANTIPNFDLVELVTPSPFTPLGTKGGSETNILGPPPLILQAVEDALRDYGITFDCLPLSMERIWERIKSASPNF